MSDLVGCTICTRIWNGEHQMLNPVLYAHLKPILRTLSTSNARIAKPQGLPSGRSPAGPLECNCKLL
jgi:hypothetical protein